MYVIYISIFSEDSETARMTNKPIQILHSSFLWKMLTFLKH